jgi:hypothetical protein
MDGLRERLLEAAMDKVLSYLLARLFPYVLAATALFCVIFGLEVVILVLILRHW